MDTKQITLEEIAFINDVIGRFNSGIIISAEEKTTFRNLLELITGQNVVEPMGSSVLTDQDVPTETVEEPITTEPNHEPETGLEDELPTEEII